ncbi:MAG: MerR family transcriptional regulator [Actinobacteria bacterium]|nr:MerR family transcriptional regulator [Actinomycetota bacterium]MCL5882798.1 MerR family transcriptional regulator [Actinomycetota bacterium]
MAYNSKTACKLVGISKRQIGYWDETHLIKPSVQEAGGRGTTRLYSFADLVQLAVVKSLIDQGISLQKIRKSINYLKKNFPQIEKPLAQLKFLTDGKTIFILTSNKKEILDTLAEGQLVFSIALGQIIENLKGEVESISQDRNYKVKVGRRNYEVILHPDLEDGGFWVECSELPGCMSQGDTVEESLEMIKDAIEGHLEVLTEDAVPDKKLSRSA